MKTIKTLLAASMLLAIASSYSVTPETIAKLEKERAAEEKTFPKFAQLPSEIQLQILGAINESATPLGAAKRLIQLRRVSSQMRDYIDSEYTSKYLMQRIANRFQQNDRMILQHFC